MKFNRETVGTISKSAGNGMVKLASGTITDPVAFVQLALPVQYERFSIEFWDLTFSDSDDLTAALSFDGGTTFVADNVHFDTYTVTGIGRGSNATFSFFDAVLEFGDGTEGTYTNTPIPTDLTIELHPGSDTFLPRGFWKVSAFRVSPTEWDYVTGTFGMTVVPVVPPVAARANAIQFQPYGNADFPPTGGQTITTGSYILWGIAP